MSETSTWSDLGSQTASRRRRNGRRLGFLLLLLIVLAGLLNVLGPRASTARAEADGYTLEVVHAAVARSGQPAPLEITVDSPVPFTKPIEIVLDARLFDSLDFQNWYPNPDSETRAGDELSYEFAPPEGNQLVVHLDARVSPGLALGPEPHWVELLIGDEVVARVDYEVWVAP